jgi:hypothetical protein
MIQRDEVMRTILEETLESGRQGNLTESGRTVCGTAKQPLPPILRRYAQVTLPTCPRTVGGTWHTHITRDQLINPENSLPDWANVVFGVIDVSIVVGAETSEVVVGSADRSKMQHELRQVLGVDVDSPEEVVEAIIDGEVQNPPMARVRLRQQLSPLVFEVETSFSDLARDIRSTDAVVQAMLRGGLEMVAACPMYGPTVEQYLRAPSGPFFLFRELGESNARVITKCAKRLLPPEDVDIRATAWGTAIGFLVSNALADLLTS